MKRLWLIVALCLAFAGRFNASAATPDENKMYRVSEAAFKDGLYDLAERQFVDYLKQFPDSERADGVTLDLAQAQLKQGKWQAAVSTLQDALAKWPTEKRPDSFRFWLAEALARGERYAEAEQRYQELVDKYRGSAYHQQALYGLAFARFKQAHFSRAMEALDELDKLGPKADLAQDEELLRGQVHLALKQFQQAETVLDSVATKYPRSRAAFRANIWLGESLSRRNQFDDALKRYETVLSAYKSNPNKPVGSQLAAEAWRGEAWVFWQQQKYDDAAQAFAQALTQAQDPSLKREAMLKLGEAYVRGGKLVEGVTKLKAYLQWTTNDPLADEIQMTVADLLMGNNDFAGALPEYATLISKYPQSAQLAKANFNAGWCAWKLEKLDESLPYFRQAAALAKDPALAADALFKVGDTEFALGKFSDAINDYQRLISTYPETKLIERAVFQLGQSYQHTRNAEAAVHVFESLVQQYPKSTYAAEAQFDIGSIESGTGKESEARTAFAAVVTTYPQSDWASKARLAIGESFYREGKYDEATAEFEKLIAAAPDSELGQRAFYNRGWCYVQKGQPDKTLADFGQFLKQFPNSALAPDVQFWIADYYLKRKDYIRAQEQFQVVTKNYATSKLADSAQYMAGRAAYLRQDYKAAIEIYEALLKNFPDSAWRCDARFGQGDALSELGQFADALIVFDSLIKEFPNCYVVGEAQGRKGDCQFTLGRFEDAIASYRKALDGAQDADPSFRDQLYYKIGQSNEKSSKLDEAFDWYSKAVYEQSAAPDPNAPPERFWMCKAGLAAGGVKEQRQQWREAILLYQKLSELCPDMKPLLDERARKLRVDHLILF